MASTIKLRNNLITIHNGGVLSAVGPSRDVNTAHISQGSTTTSTISTIEDISSWAAGDIVVFSPSTDNLQLVQRKIISIQDSTTFTIDIPINGIELDTLPEYIPHITNVSKNFKITGKDYSSRGGIRALDSATLDISNVEFGYWGIPADDSSNGIVLLTNNTFTPKISSCSLNNDGLDGTRFVSVYEDGIRTQISNLNFQNNIVYNSGESSVMYDLSVPLSADLILNNNLFLNGSMYISNVSSRELSASNSVYIGSDNNIPAVYIDCEDIEDLNFQNSIIYSNKQGATLFKISDTTIKDLTATYNSTKSIFLNEPSNIVAQDIISNNNTDTGVQIEKSSNNLLLQNISSCFNSNINIFVNRLSSISNSAVTAINSTINDGGYGIFYSGDDSLLIDNLSASNNTIAGIRASFSRTATQTNNSLTTINSHFSGNNVGLLTTDTNNIYLTPNNLVLTDNTLINNNIGVRALNIVGDISGNTFTFNTEDLQLTIGNNFTNVIENTATTHLGINSYKHLNITGGVNYYPINIHTNTLSLSNYNIVPGGVNLLKFEGPTILNSWPGNGVSLKLQYSEPQIDKECVLFYYTDPKIKYFKLTFSGITFSSKEWQTAVYKNDTLVRVLPVRSTIKVILPPDSNTTQLYNKFLLMFEKTGPRTITTQDTINININKIQYSYDDITYTDLDISTLHFNNNITYSPNTSPEFIVNSQGIKNTYTNLITLNNTNFKDFKVHNVMSPSYINFDLKLTGGLVMGSYLLRNVKSNIDPFNVQDFYQSHTEKSIGIVCSSEDNSSTYYKNGYILRNNVNLQDVNDQNNAAAEVMYPNTNTVNKLKSGRKYVAVKANESTTVYAHVKKSISYNGNAPRLMMSRNAALGIPQDTVMGTLTASYGMWQALKGVTLPSLHDGIFEFYVDCDGTAGFVAVDSWAAPIANVTGTVTKTSHIVT